MIISAIGEEEDLAKLFSMVGLLMGCTWTAFILQYLLVYCGMYIVLVRKNPFTYTKHLAPAQIMAFASASSAATIPVSISSAMSSGHVSETIARFVIPLGATVSSLLRVSSLAVPSRSIVSVVSIHPLLTVYNTAAVLTRIVF